jgi:hypothetical protein
MSNVIKLEESLIAFNEEKSWRKKQAQKMTANGNNCHNFEKITLRLNGIRMGDFLTFPFNSYCTTVKI